MFSLCWRAFHFISAFIFLFKFISSPRFVELNFCQHIWEMTQFLPPNLLVLFAARDPIPYLPPTDKPTHEKKRQAYTGVADYLDHFEVNTTNLLRLLDNLNNNYLCVWKDPEETPPPYKPETKLQKLERKVIYFILFNGFKHLKNFNFVSLGTWKSRAKCVQTRTRFGHV